MAPASNDCMPDEHVVNDHVLDTYSSPSGRFEPIWTLEIQTVAEDVDKILDAIFAVHPLAYGRYERTASISAVGRETARPETGSTTDSHGEGFTPGGTETYPMVELKVSIERDVDALRTVMEAVLEVHHYEQPVIFLREDWASRATYDPHSTNPNRWWNNGKGLPGRLA